MHHIPLKAPSRGLFIFMLDQWAQRRVFFFLSEELTSDQKKGAPRGGGVGIKKRAKLVSLPSTPALLAAYIEAPTWPCVAIRLDTLIMLTWPVFLISLRR